MHNRNLTFHNGCVNHALAFWACFGWSNPGSSDFLTRPLLLCNPSIHASLYYLQNRAQGSCSLPGETRMPRPIIWTCRPVESVGRSTAIRSTFGASNPVVKTFTLTRHLRSPDRNRFISSALYHLVCFRLSLQHQYRAIEGGLRHCAHALHRNRI